MDSLKHKNLLSMMARMRSLVSVDEVIPECSEVDWTVPHHFSSKKLELFTDLGNNLVEYVDKALQVVCEDNFEVKLSSINEYFASVLSDQMNQDEQNLFFLPITLADKRDIGFLCLSFETCTILIRQILCDPEAQIGEEGVLSSLEESILQDNIFSIADSLLQGFSECGRIKMLKGKQLVRGQWPASFCGLEEMSRISFEASCDSSQLELSFYLLDEVVDPLFGIPLPNVSPERLKDVPRDVTERVQDVPVDVWVGLNPSMMTLKSILTLEEDDVVVLDHKVTTPTNVMIEKKLSFSAWPAKSEGNLAVVIAEKQIDENC